MQGFAQAMHHWEGEPQFGLGLEHFPISFVVQRVHPRWVHLITFDVRKCFAISSRTRCWGNALEEGKLMYVACHVMFASLIFHFKRWLRDCLFFFRLFSSSRFEIEFNLVRVTKYNVLLLQCLLIIHDTMWLLLSVCLNGAKIQKRCLVSTWIVTAWQSFSQWRHLWNVRV